MFSQVQQRKAELHGLGDGIEQLRGVCRQLHSHLRQIPECTMVPFESEADALMDSWLDVSVGVEYYTKVSCRLLCYKTLCFNEEFTIPLFYV